MALTAPTVRADILATLEVPSPSGTNLDIGIVNAATGARTALPAGVNSAADDLHPSLSSDGRRLVFWRDDLTAGTTRIITCDLATGRTADLFDAFAAQQDQPSTPSIAADGSSVLTGRPLEHRNPSTPPSLRQASITRTSLASFPSGPFPHSIQTFAFSFSADGRTRDPIQRGGRLAFGVIVGDTGISDIELETPTGSGIVSEPSTFLSHPALSSSLVVFERRPIVRGGLESADLAFRTADPAHVASAPDGFLPRLVNTSFDESHPAFTSDDRFLGFIRPGQDQRDRLFVFDTQTQTLLNPDGIVVGSTTDLLDRGRGNLVLQERLVLSGATLRPSGALSANLLASTGVGILVQRIVGHHKLLGKTVPKLRLVGRVPFGPQRKGRFRTRWDHKVNGEPLAAGRYLVTLRAVTSTGVVRELGRSFEVLIRR